MLATSQGLGRAFPWMLTCFALCGCDVKKFAANQTIKVIEAGSGATAAFWDYEVAGAAMPSTIMQAENLLRVTPDNETLLLGLAQTYIAYNYGWLQLDWERADEAGDFARADHLEQRVRLFYERATHLAMRALRAHDDEERLDEELDSGDLGRVQAYLKKNFDEQEDVSPLYWAGLAWGSVIANSGGDMDQFADAPIARSLLERSVELDPTYQDAGGLGVLGTVEAVFPELFGGDLDKAKAYYERGLELCDRKNHMILVGYAKSYGVAAQDRELFVSLLTEVIEAPDQGDRFRLGNKVARVRAQYYLTRVDDWFMPTDQGS